MSWIPVTKRMPSEMDKTYYFVKYGQNQTKGTLFGRHFEKWNVTHWQDESVDLKEYIPALEGIWSFYQAMVFTEYDVQLYFEKIPQLIEILKA